MVESLQDGDMVRLVRLIGNCNLVIEICLNIYYNILVTGEEWIYFGLGGG